VVNWLFQMRILFPKGEQRKFIESVLLKMSITESAKLCKLSERTIRDWRREKFLMHRDALLKLCKAMSISLPENIIEKDDYWYSDLSTGGKVVMQKYGFIGGNPEYRKKKWREWWNKKGKFLNNPIFKRKFIRIPQKSAKLAEFIGIMLGDGGFTAYGAQIQITLNSRDDKEYIEFVSNLIYELFNKKPSTFPCKDAIASKISVASMDLTDYLVKLGLKVGNKITLQVDIPDWIKKNRAYSIACIRGLVDTDGCIFKHTYKVNNKFYNYKKLAFVSYSQPLRKSVYDILKSLGLNPRLFSYRDVRIDSQLDMEKYFSIIGSSNQKHLNRYYK